MNSLMSFDCDPITRERLEDIARMTGIGNNAATIRFVINQVWAKMDGEKSRTEVKTEEIKQIVERR